MTGSKKKWSPSIHEKRLLVEPRHSELSIVEQCSLLGLARSSYYHKPAIESELNLELMRLMDEQYMHQPSWGVPRMTAWLNNRHGFQVNKKRMARLMKIMGIRGIVPSMKVRTSLQNSKHQVFPYLLKGKQILRANEVWASDITYIPMERGFMYLVAILDLHSRYVVSWELSNSLETSFCLEALEEALSHGTPELFNTDKGTQYTSSVFVEKLLSEGIQPSMTGSGRCWDNIHMERLWWSVKYEDVYLKEYPTVPSLYRGLGSYFDQYNGERPHEALGRKTPRQVFMRSHRKHRRAEPVKGKGASFLVPAGRPLTEPARCVGWNLEKKQKNVFPLNELQEIYTKKWLFAVQRSGVSPWYTWEISWILNTIVIMGQILKFLVSMIPMKNVHNSVASKTINYFCFKYMIS